MEEQKARTNYPRKIARILLKTLLFIVLFVILIFLIILTPPAQRYLTSRVEAYLEKKLETRVDIKRISFGLSGKVELQDIYIEDRQKDTLFAGGSIKANIALLKLFSNEVQVKDIELHDLYMNIKRQLPDTSFNFQFIIDAFVSEQAKNPDTATTAPLKFNVSDFTLDNIRLRYNDVITGSDWYARIGNLAAAIDKMDPVTSDFVFSSLIGRNINARIIQHKPLLQQTATGTTEPAPAGNFHLGTLDLSRINIQFDNNVSHFYSSFNIGRIQGEGRNFDLQNSIIELDRLVLDNATSTIRLGRSEAAREAERKIDQQAKETAQQGWTFRVAELAINNNHIRFDNDNRSRTIHGIDFAHLDASALNFHTSNLVFSPDSIAGNITNGSFREKSGFVLEALRGDILYANNQTHLRDLYLKTPGSLIRRNAVLQYASMEALTSNFPATVMNIEITNSRVQVRDILSFAPHLRSNPAFRNPDAVWDLHLVGNGTLNNLNIEQLQFAGLSNTSINANGTLTGLMNPQHAGGNFVIHQFRTSQSDIALFTGQRLSNAQVNLPEVFNINGTVRGNAGALTANLNLASSAGNVGFNGTISQLTRPAATRYNATITTRGLALGSILRQQGTIGSVTGTISLNGTGITPEAINTSFRGNISSLGYNQYNYRNIRLDGVLRPNRFSADVAMNDPNASFDLRASGSFGDNTSFIVTGMIDSLKTQPLNFTPDPMVFRGRINANVANLNPDYLDANVLVTDALIVSQDERLFLDTITLVSGRTDTSNYIRLTSDIANAGLEGQYRFSELGQIIQSSIQPYFMVTPPASAPALQPYNFRFFADLYYAPIYSAFLPGLTEMRPVHAEGSFVSGQGLNGFLTTEHLAMEGNKVSDLNIRFATTERGLEVSGIAGRLISGGFDVQNPRINAIAINNVIDFNVGIDDINERNKYYISGLVRQPQQGTFAISLKPDSLLLNYERWNVAANNEIIIAPESITANNFVLSKGSQQLAIQSLAGSGNNQPLEVRFTDFRLGTISGFMKSDTLVADGLINGVVTFQNLAQQPAFTSQLSVADLSFRKDTLGNLDLNVSTSGERYNTNLTLTGRGNDVVMNGYFTPSGNALDLNLDLNIRELNLATIEGFTNDALTNSSGSISGDVRIRGSSADPSIRGDVNFNNTSFALSFLGSQYYIDNEKLTVTENGLRLDNFTIRDSANNRLNLNGDIFTTDFTTYRFGFTVTARDFLLLNSVREKNRLYYGRLNISSDLRVNGTSINPIIDGSLTVNEGTNLTIVVPQEEPGVVQREGVVEFVNMSNPEADTLFRGVDSLNFSPFTGMDIAANIEVTKEAILNVIIDEANGDFLNVQGEALLSAGIDPSGKITMVGNYTLEQGAYEISIQVLRRRFEIVKGSTITWTGEPTTARLDVNAVYVANTPPINLVQDQLAASTPAIRNTYMQRLPFEVRLNLTGELLRPEVNFDILLPESRNYGVSNDIVTLVQARLNQLRQDEGEINKQVFALLLLGRFVGENPLESSGGGFELGAYARQSVSKLLTEQLNQLAAGLVGGVEIDFDVATTDDYTTGDRRSRTDLNVGLSKQLLNDRLRVTVGSNFQLEGPQNSNQRDNNIAGNVALDYQLSKDGRYLLRFFRRNQYEGVVDGYIIENGLSFILSVDYNRFREILKRRKQRVTRTGTTEIGGTND